MQTNFSLAQLADPAHAEADRILRACVHCGFCTATCPTYVLLGDELDGPRGRIYLIKDMLESDQPATAETVKHLDRCLTCLSCVTTCPSGVDYMHLAEHGRAHVAATYRRPWRQRALRGFIAAILPRPRRLRIAVAAARLARPFAAVFARLGLPELAQMLRLASVHHSASRETVRPGARFAAQAPRRARVALLSGCVNDVLAPQINAAAVRVLTRHGIDVVVAEGEGCCGALEHDLGEAARARAAARRNIVAWTRERDRGGLDAILVTASGCGTAVKDYGHLLAGDPLQGDAERVAALAKDISEFLAGLDLVAASKPGLVVAYHSACSLQHGQRIHAAPKALLQRLGFVVREPAESHLCCGSAGTYNLLEPDLANQLGARKVAALDALRADVIAAGNLGCITQIAAASATPVVHTVELIDWATGGPNPISATTAARQSHRSSPQSAPD